MSILNQSLKDKIFAQKRTGHHKQFVWFDGDYVVKGPYTQEKLTIIINRSTILKAWQSPCIIHMVDHFKDEAGYFIRYYNLMKDTVMTGEFYKESFSGYSYRIANNKSLITLKQALEIYDWATDNIEDLLLGLCHCYLLDVGDMNTSNILVDPIKKTYSIIDYDETCTQVKDCETFYFNRPPALAVNWLSRIRKHYDGLIIKLKTYYGKLYVDNNKLDKIIAILSQSNMQSTITLERPIITTSRQGAMIFKGIRGGNSKTYSGIDFDVAKSALQKYIRRGVSNKAILAAMEMYRFGEIEGANANVTNMYNRVAIIAAEDIGIANVPLVLEVIKLVEGKDRDTVNLAAMVHALASSSKTRLMSHAWNAYVINKDNARKSGITIDSEISTTDIEYVNTHFNNSILNGVVDNEMRYYVLVFLKRLQESDYNAYTWAGFFLARYKDAKIGKRNKYVNKYKRGSTGISDILLWNVLALVLDNTIHDILVEAYYNHTESRPFLQLAILIAIHKVPYQPFDLTVYTDMWKDNIILTNMLSGIYLLEIDDYVIDKHTSQGRKLGMGTKEFVTNGSLVTPQDLQYYNPLLEKLYMDRE